MTKARIARTLTEDRKDSASAKTRTEARLIARMSPMKSAAHIQTGVEGNHPVMIMAAPMTPPKLIIMRWRLVIRRSRARSPVPAPWASGGAGAGEGRTVPADGADASGVLAMSGRLSMPGPGFG